MPNHHDHANLIWQIADLLRGPYRPPQYERVMLPMTVLRRFDGVLAPTKAKVLTEYDKRKGGKLTDDALDQFMNKAAGQRFHNHSPLDFQKLKGDPDNLHTHLRRYIRSFSANVRTIFEFFEFESEIERMHEAGILHLVVSKFSDVDLHPSVVRNKDMGLIFENLIRRLNELANETAGDYFAPRLRGSVPHIVTICQYEGLTPQSHPASRKNKTPVASRPRPIGWMEVFTPALRGAGAWRFPNLQTSLHPTQ